MARSSSQNRRREGGRDRPLWGGTRLQPSRPGIQPLAAPLLQPNLWTRAHVVVTVALGEPCTGSLSAHKADGENATLTGDFEGAVRCLARAFPPAAQKNGLSGCESSTALHGLQVR